METLKETRVWTSPMRLAWLAFCAAALAGAANAGAGGPPSPGCENAARCIVRVQDGGVTAKDRAKGLLGQAHALVRSGNTDRALANLEEAIRLDATLTDAYVGRGLLLHQRGDEARAFADLTQALQFDPDNAGAHSILGDVLQAQRNPDGAIAEYETALRLQSTLGSAYLGRGISRASKGDNAGAIADYATAMRFDATLAAAALRNRGVANTALGNVDEGIADFSASIQMAPIFPRAYINRGLLYARRGQLDLSIADFTMAMRFDPRSTDAYVLRGIASYYSGDARQALSDANTSVELSPNLVTASLWLEIISGRKAELAAFAARADLTAWPGPVVKMMLGETTLDALLAAADGLSPNQKARNTCQATFYAGQLKALEDARGEARALFEKAAAVCPPSFIEYFAANAELKATQPG